MKADCQRKALQYWNMKGLDVTSEWVMDYMTGLVPLTWHFKGFVQEDYLRVPASVCTLSADFFANDEFACFGATKLLNCGF
ncbi:MAG: hypothetical protein LBL07_04900 [Tannerella sp.]|jgi:hypothetical protein|nr:hypothetical protein [Tannerella sp.]